DPVAAAKGRSNAHKLPLFSRRPLGCWVRRCVTTAARSGRSVICRPTRFTMRRIIQANIDRFIDLLKTETDATKRRMEKKLLAEEEAKLKQLPAYDKKEPKAY